MPKNEAKTQKCPFFVQMQHFSGEKYQKVNVFIWQVNGLVHISTFSVDNIVNKLRSKQQSA